MNGIIDELRAALVRSGLIRQKSGWLGSFALGFGAGLFAGAATALLFAPQAGPDTRQKLGSTARQLAGRTAGLVERARGTVGQIGTQLQGAKPGRNDAPVS